MQRNHKAWVVAVDMGYGHQRAAYPMHQIAEGSEVIAANKYEGIPKKDKDLWDRAENFYNFISRLKGRGFLGDLAFSIFDLFQRIRDFYPKRYQILPTIQLWQIQRQIKSGWGKHLIEKLSQKPLPLLATFFNIAHMADYWGYPGPIYCLTTDSDISRAWAPYNPQKSRVVYLASTARAAARLEQYGVKRENIRLTGFPLPKELVGENDEGARLALSRRLPKLDPFGNYLNNYGALIKEHLLMGDYPEGADRGVPSVMFAVGGASAQTGLAFRVLEGMAPLVKQGKAQLVLSVGVSKVSRDRMKKKMEELNLNEPDCHILFAETKPLYFRAFNNALSTTDILWTKPSELSFYSALGLPILIAPPVGAQEIQNRKWLHFLEAAYDQLPPEDAYEWLPDILEAGTLARCAMNGYINIPRSGAWNVEKIVLGK